MHFVAAGSSRSGGPRYSRDGWTGFYSRVIRCQVRSNCFRRFLFAWIIQTETHNVKTDPGDVLSYVRGEGHRTRYSDCKRNSVTNWARGFSSDVSRCIKCLQCGEFDEKLLRERPVFSMSQVHRLMSYSPFMAGQVAQSRNGLLQPPRTR